MTDVKIYFMIKNRASIHMQLNTYAQLTDIRNSKLEKWIMMRPIL